MNICESCGEEMDGSEYDSYVCDGCYGIIDEEEITPAE